MTIKEKRAFLSQYQMLSLRIKALKLEIEKLRSLVECRTQILDTSRGSGRPGDRVGNVCVSIMDDEEQLKKEIAAALRARNEIRNMIQRVPDEEARELLRLRYLCGQKVWQIAAEKQYDERFLKKKLSNAVTLISKV